MTHVRTVALAGAAIIASTAVALAEPLAPEPVPASHFYAVVPTMDAHQDYSYYERAGSRGRLGLGANPMRPEGPANLSD